MTKPKDVNRNIPIVHKRVIKDFPGIAGTIYEYNHVFYAAKTKNKYRPKQRTMAVTVDKNIERIPYADEDIEIKFFNDTKEFISKGRYHDYFFVERAIYG